MKIIAVEVEQRRLPAARLRVSLSDPPPTASEPRPQAFLVRIRTDSGLNGLGFTSTAAPGAGAVRSVLESDLPPLLLGEDPVLTDRLFARALSAFRGVGFAGVSARAYAAIDIALWDLKAKALGQPLHLLLGSARQSVPFFVSDAALLEVSAADALAAARRALETGAAGVLVEIGSGNIEADGQRVESIREAIGDDAWLGVHGNSRFDLATALAVAHFLEEDVGIDWLEQPLPPEDGVGYSRLAERMEVPLALGSSFSTRDEFVRVLQAGNVRVLRPDVLRLGGVTPLVKLAYLAEAFAVTLCPWRLPEVGVHLACGLPNITMVDYSGELTPLLVQQVRNEDGRLYPPGDPGLGLEFTPARQT